MKNLLAVALAMLFFITAIVHTSVTAKAGYTTDDLLRVHKQAGQLDKKILTQRCDSLVLEHNFKAVKNICQPYFADPGYSEVVFPYLLAAYYFTGDSIQSSKMLLKEIKEKTYSEITDYLISNNVALIKYFEIDHNREPVILLALEKYRNTANASRPQEGEQVIRFLINDQRIRKLKYAYKKESSASLEQLNRFRTTADSIQNNNIYQFYKQQGRYFSKSEIGEEACSWQLIFFSHITDIALRQTFFRSLLEKAVKEGIIEKESLVNFVLRTESFTNPAFWDTINDRLPEIRKQYDLSDSYIFTPF
ncbi:MAG: hypothetical protein EOO20_11160 [Chryseobacterium sp.]|nr:MAG: hypothetical protein EOO20_11160 [Chryseobacterium sp.]